MKCNDNDNTRSDMRRCESWFESKRVNDSAMTATVTMIVSALRHNNIQDMII